MRGRIALCAVCLLLVVAALPAFAGEFETSLKDGAWALQFGIGSDFRLTTFEPSAIALK